MSKSTASTPRNSIVWFELPVPDLDRGVAFYNEVLQVELIREDMDGMRTAKFPVLDGKDTPSGHLFIGTPAPAGQGSVTHLACPGRLEDGMERLARAGGKVLSDPIAIPFGRFTYCQDPFGNSIGLYVETGQE
ncbi:VOC family protein [Microvirga tunisiensis]|uniref:VOC family protein n=1 Tax=Pannonibacter tanglangensis TaxID=2750084 RepID=A0A7X5F2B3_9HYPH|nr:VOC family protein [Pannonibacter sp. XCT-53]NBN78455.1 VOC family protein [Pannonibacter sp. XCT-53]